jgi:hypothetical protein
MVLSVRRATVLFEEIGGKLKQKKKVKKNVPGLDYTTTGCMAHPQPNCLTNFKD